jgi:hypothetical protein
MQSALGVATSLLNSAVAGIEQCGMFAGDRAVNAQRLRCRSMICSVYDQQSLDSLHRPFRAVVKSHFS